jgi:hypothetical protein
VVVASAILALVLKRSIDGGRDGDRRWTGEFTRAGVHRSTASSDIGLRSAIVEARSAGRPFIASAARHSLGGQSLARNGTVLTLDRDWLEADRTRTVFPRRTDPAT